MAAHSVKREVKRALQPLIGEPLTDMWRYAGMQKFEFGVQRPYKNRRGQNVTRADWGLVVSCDWKLSSPGGGSVSSDDYGPHEARYRDREAGPVIQELLATAPTVEGISAEDSGGIQMQMSAGYLLEIIPCNRSEEPDETQWRFMPKDRGSPHVVMLASGIEK